MSAAATRLVLGALATLTALTIGPWPAASPARAQGDCIVIENFTGDAVGAFPASWKPRKDAGKGVYAVQEDNGLRFLRAVSRGLGIQAARQHEWDLDAYPVLTWSWRPQEFPRGANEQDGENDSALAVYLLVPYSRVVGPKAVKYIWSEVVPVGTRLESNHGLTQVRVLRSGTAQRGEWVQERVNVRDDFRQFFKEAATPRPAGIAVLTDADDTRSTARGDYANFRACRG